MDLNGKRIAVLGAGGSGYAAAVLAVSLGAEVAAFDGCSAEKLADAVEKFSRAGVVLTCGDLALQPTGRFDLSIISPGIDANWPIGVAFAAVSEELIGEIEFAYRLGSTPVIAITGTNGKTTTTSLVTRMLQSAGLRAISAGNIGLPYSEVVHSGENFDWIVLEVSSFQLETISSFSPSVAVWMNFAPDHMDRYRTVEEYFGAKFRLFENLVPEALVIHKYESHLGLKARTVTFSAFGNEAGFSYENGVIHHSITGRSFSFSSCQLQGKHNAENVMVALAIADHLGIAWDDVSDAIRTYEAPPHRCEKVDVINGVLYLNDSKSTNLHSLESALGGQDGPVVLIVGGKDKGLNFGELRSLAAKMAKKAICIGEIAETIQVAWDGAVECELAGTLDDAVLIAARSSDPGETVLFSPGTSSFDMFTGYEARGIAFREAVKRLRKS